MKNLIVSRNPARRSAAQRRASKRNIKKAQAARRRGGGRRRKTTRRRRRNPTHRAPARTTRTVRRSNQARRRLPTFQGILNNQVIPAAVGGTGAVINDMLVNLLPLPINFKTGWML